MEIKRSFEKLVVTKRRYVIHQMPLDKQIACPQCGEPMLPTEQAAGLFGIKLRWIFQIIETKQVHFIEAEADEIKICLTSLAEVLNNDENKD